MSVYVGIDVHRKHSQVAVVDDAGVVLKNRNVVNGVETILSLIGEYPTHTPVAFEAAYGWGGWSSCWTTTATSRIWFTRRGARRSRRPG
jgi:hypothetical protein